MILAHYLTGRRLQVTTVAIVAVLACSAAYVIKKTPPPYSESAGVMFMLPRDQTAANALFVLAPSLITSEQATIQVLTGPLMQRRIRAAGGTADVSMKLYNRYSDEYPEYSEPLATLTAVSPSPATAHRSFLLAASAVRQTLASWQKQAGVPRRSRITAQIIATSGPRPLRGSAKRADAGLAVLMVMGGVTAWRLLRRRERTGRHATGSGG